MRALVCVCVRACALRERERGREGERDRQTDRQTERQRQAGRGSEEIKRDGENSNPKTLILRDRSIHNSQSLLHYKHK